MENQEKRDMSQDEWICVKCHTHNPKYYYVCKCGMKKSENGMTSHPLAEGKVLLYALDAIGNKIFINQKNKKYFISEINTETKSQGTREELFPKELLVHFSIQRLNEWICNTFAHKISELKICANEGETRSFLMPLINSANMGEDPVYVKSFEKQKVKKILFARPKEKEQEISVLYSNNHREWINVSRKGNEFKVTGVTNGYPDRFSAGALTVSISESMIENYEKSVFDQWLRSHLWHDIYIDPSVDDTELKRLLKAPPPKEVEGPVYVEDFGDVLEAKEIVKEFSDIGQEKLGEVLKKTPQIFHVRSIHDFCGFINAFGGKAFTLGDAPKSVEDLKYDALNATYIPGGGYKVSESEITLVDWPLGSIKFNLDNVSVTYKYTTDQGKEDYTCDYSDESIITVGKIFTDADEYFKNDIFNTDERTDPTIVWRKDYDTEIPWAHSTMEEIINEDFEIEKVPDEIAALISQHHWHNDKFKIFKEVGLEDDNNYTEIWCDCRGSDEKSIFKKIESRIKEYGINSYCLWHVIIDSPESIDPDRIKQYAIYRHYKAEFIFLVSKGNRMEKASRNKFGEYLSLNERGEYVSQKVMDWYDPFEEKKYVTQIKYVGYSHDGSETYFALITSPVDSEE